MKKIIIFFLIIILAFSFTITSFAESFPDPSDTLTNGQHWFIYYDTYNNSNKTRLAIGRDNNRFMLFQPYSTALGTGYAIEGPPNNGFDVYDYDGTNWVQVSRPPMLLQSKTVLIRTNYDITDEYLNVVFSANSNGTNVSTDPVIAINYPSEGQKFSMKNYGILGDDNKITMKIEFKNMPYNGSYANLKLHITGYMPNLNYNSLLESMGWYPKYYGLTYNTDKTAVSGYCDIPVYLYFNKTTTLTAKITDYLGNYYSTSVNVFCYQDFMDENKDGKDDRIPDVPGDSGDSDETGTNTSDLNVPNNGNILDWLVWLGKSINTIVGSLGDIFNSLGSFVDNFSLFFAKIFSFLPKEITTLLIFGMTIVIILRILKR